MFDRSACAKVRLAVEPHTDLSALVMLGALLRDVRNRRSTASDAADSSVSLLPGDQNRGESTFGWSEIEGSMMILAVPLQGASSSCAHAAT